MVFSSLPVYLDPPNWLPQQQLNLQQGASSNENPSDQLPSLRPMPPHVGSGGGGTGLVRPSSMAEHARLAKIPVPEAGLKCPRCESTNTKFCYFNNYSLTQPRHFCKTCRRYWTRGGAIRNVPVGGRFRKNKKNKNSKSQNPNEKLVGACTTTTTTTTSSSNTKKSSLASNNNMDIVQLPLMASLHNIAQYGIGANIGLNFGGVQGHVVGNIVGSGDGDSSRQTDNLGFHMNVSSGGLQQAPFFAPHSTSLYHFSSDRQGMQAEPSALNVGASIYEMKMEENHHGLNLSGTFSGANNSGSHQFWDGNSNL